MNNKIPNDYKRGSQYAPMWLYTVVYILTCLLGALLLLSGYRPFNALFEYFTGTKAPHLTSYQLSVNLFLLLIAPFLMWIGYAVAIRVPIHKALDKVIQNRFNRIAPSNAPWLYNLVFYLLTLLALVQIAQTGSFARLGSWFDYGSWIVARWHVFSSISFWGFVYIYLFVPISAALILISWHPDRPALQVFRWLPAVIAILMGLLVFLKKSVVVTLIIIISTWALFLLYSGRGRRIIRRVTWGGVIVTAITYFTLVVAPVYFETSRTVDEVATELETIAKNKGLEFSKYKTKKVSEKKEKLIRLGQEIGFENRGRAILLYAIMSPLTRTSAPSLYYPVVFPEKHEFYGLDIGQDIIGFGSMPDDNKVVWAHMNPDIPGAIVAPFQFVLYSQVGLLGALVGSMFLGFVIGVFWSAIQSQVLPPVWTSLAGGMIFLFAIYLAIDSVRNSTLVSYGVLWGIIFIAVMFLLELLISKLRALKGN